MENIIEKFLKFECEKCLFSKHIDNYFYWPFIRFEIYIQITQFNNYKSSNSTFIKFKNVPHLIYCFFQSIFKNPFRIHNYNKILFLQSPLSNLDIDGHSICRFTDLIIDKFDDEVCISDSFVTNKNRRRKINYSIESLEFFYKLLYKFFFCFSKFKIAINNHASELKSILYDEFNVDISEKYISKIIFKSLFIHNGIIKMYKKLLLKIKPKCIVYQQYYNIEHMCMNEVAKSLGIDTIELQHGVIGNSHIAYNFLSSKNYNFFPTKIFFWGEYWKNTARIPIGDKNKIVTGFPYYDYQIGLYNHTKNKSNKFRILVLSQDTVTCKFVSIFDELLTKFEANNVAYELIYKLHPLEFNNDMNIYNRIRNHQNVKFINNLNVSLYECFANSDIQISENSTALFEGLRYNLNTYIYGSKIGRVYMKILKDEYNAEFFENSDDLFNLIVSSKQTNNNNSDRFFKPNSLATIVDELNKYL